MLFDNVVYGVPKIRGVGQTFFSNDMDRTFGETTLKKRSGKCYNKREEKMEDRNV